MKVKKEDIELLNQLLSTEIGISISDDKSSMLELRLSKRIKELKLKNVNHYLDYIAGEEEEKNILFNLLTTNYTKFFREKFHFELLFKKIIPGILENKSKIRIWSAGCSTGEEPYTIAMMLAKNDLKYSIIATDINTEVLKYARGGIYNKQKIKNINSEYLHNYFRKGVGKYKGYYKIKKSIRERISFKKLNLNSSFSAEFSKDFDIIFCRNVLIYFENEKKKQVLRELKKTMIDGGYLVLGHSESIDLSIKDNLGWRKIGKNSYQKLS
ncbi:MULTISPECIES: CheR family methyltransferase [Halanaerobium]|uniref:protein-glutamate O-methyltransferase n=1 Tax=Halanaerobium kushneri TaxID=56779 RepID=A0A1N6VTJ2_9FIRM|nr:MULTISPECIES: protein-glutamate O-methyltransferase CheR [Halanaerobium]RCW56566.1 CheR-type MCP methyltransferase [Halanaerobium sp. ST460_2HS_T2]SIQ81182.1 MCP methyltransferase, CheR-type [Halanaerobium kushneri]